MPATATPRETAGGSPTSGGGADPWWPGRAVSTDPGYADVGYGSAGGGSTGSGPGGYDGPGVYGVREQGSAWPGAEGGWAGNSPVYTPAYAGSVAW